LGLCWHLPSQRPQEGASGRLWCRALWGEMDGSSRQHRSRLAAAGNQERATMKRQTTAAQSPAFQSELSPLRRERLQRKLAKALGKSRLVPLVELLAEVAQHCPGAQPVAPSGAGGNDRLDRLLADTSAQLKVGAAKARASAKVELPEALDFLRAAARSDDQRGR